MVKHFSVTNLMLKKGKKYSEEGFIKFLESYGFSDNKVGKSEDGYIRIHTLQPVEIKGLNKKEPRTIFIKCDEEMVIQKIEWSHGHMSSVEAMNKSAGQGCLILIGIIVVISIVISACMNMVDIDSDSDCNDSYIEQDYNGDGEKDAEDFRIQTEAC